MRRCGSRFDLPGHTVYAATKRATAYREVLAYSAPSADGYAALRADAVAVGVGIDVLLQEMVAAGMPVEGVDSDWRDARRLYRLQLSGRLWVALRNNSTLSTLAARFRNLLEGRRLDYSDATGSWRLLTTSVAEWISGQSLIDPSGNTVRPDGVAYTPKSGISSDDDPCWAQCSATASFGCVVLDAAPLSVWDPDALSASKDTGVAFL